MRLLLIIISLNIQLLIFAKNIDRKLIFETSELERIDSCNNAFFDDSENYFYSDKFGWNFADTTINLDFYGKAFGSGGRIVKARNDSSKLLKNINGYQFYMYEDKLESWQTSNKNNYVSYILKKKDTIVAFINGTEKFRTTEKNSIGWAYSWSEVNSNGDFIYSTKDRGIKRIFLNDIKIDSVKDGFFYHININDQKDWMYSKFQRTKASDFKGYMIYNNQPYDNYIFDYINYSYLGTGGGFYVIEEIPDRKDNPKYYNVLINGQFHKKLKGLKRENIILNKNSFAIRVNEKESLYVIQNIGIVGRFKLSCVPTLQDVNISFVIRKNNHEEIYCNGIKVIALKIKSEDDRVLTSNIAGEFVRLEKCSNDSFRIIEHRNKEIDTISIDNLRLFSSYDFFMDKQSRIPVGFNQCQNAYFTYCEVLDSAFVLFNGQKSKLFPKLINYSYTDSLEHELLYAGLNKGYYIIQRISNNEIRVILNNQIFIIDNIRTLFYNCIRFDGDKLIIYSLTNEGVERIRISTEANTWYK